MPVTSGKSVGSQNVAKAGVNLEVKRASIAVNAAFDSDFLVTAGMPKLTWLVTCTQGHSVTVEPQIAFRRGAAVAPGVPFYEFLDAAPAALVSSAAPYTLELNAPAQAIRLTVTNPATAPGAATDVTVVLMASG